MHLGTTPLRLPGSVEVKLIILDLAIVSSTFRLLFPPGNSPLYTLYARLRGRGGEEKIFAWIRTPTAKYVVLLKALSKLTNGVNVVKGSVTLLTYLIFAVT
jgi:hypothetical protein